MKHTKGPWRIETWKYSQHNITKQVIQNNTDAVAEIWDIYRPDDERNIEQQGNARLIATAPEMLALLEELYAEIPKGGDLAVEWLKIKSLIEKLEG